MSSKFRSRISDDLEKLIRAIGDCKSKSEEDKILCRSIEAAKALIKSGRHDKAHMRELMIKLLYFEMLGHDASFGHFLAVQGCGSSSLQTKMVAYLSASQFLDSSDQLVLLLVNTWRSDLQNDNFLVVCTALTAICKLVNVDAMGALVPQITALITHPRDIVRKKVVMALHKLYVLDPKSEGPLAGVDIHRLVRQALCDKDPSVMAATTCALYDMAKFNPEPLRNLVPSLVSILKQICEHRLNKTYEYHHVPAPFIQIRILKILGLLGAGDHPSTDNMRSILLMVLKQSSMRNNIGHAVMYECVRTVTTISPDAQLLEAAAKSISGFLKSSNSHNLKYMGIDALAGIVRINPQKAQDYQHAVMDCLEDRDETLKLKTLGLLVKMTKPNNVEVVVGKLIAFLESCTDEHILRDICGRISELAERYAPDTHWYVETMTEMFKVAGDVADDQVAHNLMRVVAEQEDDVQKSAVAVFIGVLDVPKLPEMLLQVVCWVLGEYGCLLKSGEEIMDYVCGLVHLNACTDILKGYILTAVSKVCAQCGCSLTQGAEEFIRKAASSRSTDLQQRALELQALLSSGVMMQNVLPKDASCEDLENELPAIQSLSFLQNFVDLALHNGAAPYVSDENRMVFDTEDLVDASHTGLKFNPYEKSTLPSSPQEPTMKHQPVNVDEAPVAPVKSTSNEPQLLLNTTGTRRWGPATFSAVDNSAKQDVAPAQEDSRNIPTTLTGSALIDNGFVEETTERDILQASLFGDVNSSKTSRTKPQAKPRTEPIQSQVTQPTGPEGFDLLDLGTSNPVPSTSTGMPSSDVFSGIDLLGGIDAQPVPPAQTTQPGIDLDALYGNTPSTFGSFGGMPSANVGFVPAQQGHFPMSNVPAGMPHPVFGAGQDSMAPSSQVGMDLSFGGKPDISQVDNTFLGDPSNMPIGGNKLVPLGKQPQKADPFKDLLG